MNEAHRENLSALADGELAFDQVRFMLRRTEHDVDLRMSWTSYHLGRDCLRGEFTRLAAPDFADRVLAALDSQGVHVVRGHRRWLRWSAGGAIAASVAAVALMVAQPTATGDGGTEPARASVISPHKSLAAAPTRAAPEVPRWLSPSSPAAQLAQPASASVLDGQIRGDTLIPAAYSRHMAPYMRLHGYSSQQPSPAYRYGRSANGHWIIPMMPPASVRMARPANAH